MNRGAEALDIDELAYAEHASLSVQGRHAHPRATIRLGRVRLPLAGPYRPWATAYRMPDGRTLWCVRLRQSDRAITHCVPTSTLHAFCRMNRLDALAVEIDRVADR